MAIAGTKLIRNVSQFPEDETYLVQVDQAGRNYIDGKDASVSGLWRYINRPPPGKRGNVSLTIGKNGTMYVTALKSIQPDDELLLCYNRKWKSDRHPSVKKKVTSVLTRFPANNEWHGDIQAQLCYRSQMDELLNGTVPMAVQNEKKIHIPAHSTCTFLGKLIYRSDSSHKPSVKNGDTVMVQPVHLTGTNLLVTGSISPVSDNKIVCNIYNMGATPLSSLSLSCTRLCISQLRFIPIIRIRLLFH